jgi:AAA domain
MDFTIENFATAQVGEPQKWIIDGVIPENGTTLLYGPPKSGKSFLAIDWAMSAAAGVPWMGRSVDDDPWPVTYVAAEGGNDVLFQRLPAWVHHRGVERPQLNIVKQPVYLLNWENVEDFVADMQRLADPPLLIVLDTLAKCFLRGNENDPSDMNNAVAAIDYIKREVGTAILLVHHTGKDTGRGARGSNVLEAGVDAIFSVTVRPGGITLRNDSQRFHEPLAPMPLKLVKVSTPDISTLVIDNEIDSSSVRTAKTRNQDAVEALRRLGRARSKDWARATGLSGGSFDRMRKSLEEAGLVRKDGTEYVVVEDPST